MALAFEHALKEPSLRKTIHSGGQEALRNLLRQLRLGRNLRQQELATQLGKPQSFVSKYEAGERRLDLVELREICRVLGVSLSDFVTQFEEELSGGE